MEQLSVNSKPTFLIKSATFATSQRRMPTSTKTIGTGQYSHALEAKSALMPYINDATTAAFSMTAN